MNNLSENISYLESCGVSVEDAESGTFLLTVMADDGRSLTLDKTDSYGIANWVRTIRGSEMDLYEVCDMLTVSAMARA